MTLEMQQHYNDKVKIENNILKKNCWFYFFFQGAIMDTKVDMALPLIIFGSVGTAAGIVALWLPETRNIKLPQTLHDALNIDRYQYMVEMLYSFYTFRNRPVTLVISPP